MSEELTSGRRHSEIDVRHVSTAVVFCNVKDVCNECNVKDDNNECNEEIVNKVASPPHLRTVSPCLLRQACRGVA